VRVNDTGGDLSALVPKPGEESAADDDTAAPDDAPVPTAAAVGGSTGVA
jgi:hypothetical protein